MNTDTRLKIIDFITQNQPTTAGDIINYIQLTPAAVFRQLKKLQEQEQITKVGTPPKVFYTLTTLKQEVEAVSIPENLAKTIEIEYFTITPQGEIKSGVDGFVYWCQKQNLDVVKTAGEYVKTLSKYAIYKKDGLVDGNDKIKTTFEHAYLDQLFYLDFYSIERFGKTKLGTLILYAKQSQDRSLIEKIKKIIKNQVLNILDKQKIDAVGFIPPTIPRKIQLQNELREIIPNEIPRLKIIKINTGIPVSQKSLSNLQERELNARSTIFVDDDRKYKNILLIDDAVGSGATLNETAKKIKDKKLCTEKLIGLALVGSFKGFDVIQEI
ncbi:MAG: ArsR family transcriptional regulator [Candidatus Magasanikbacteria bacterium]